MHITNIKSLLFLPLIFLLSACSNTKLSSLKVEYETTPLGIDIEKPRFSWQMTSDKQRQSQSAFQITVYDEAGKEMWNSGKVLSDISLNIEYSGKPLEATTRYDWTLQVWNQDDKLLSAASWFETGLMNPSITAWDGEIGRAHV